MAHHSQCCTLICNIVCMATAPFVALRHRTFLFAWTSELVLILPDLFSDTEYLSFIKMPLRTAATRRCGFKLPKNDKYQCQKAGDKFQSIVKLWYCTRHDSHAQYRCQFLVEWAGKGAQCEQLGVFHKRSGKKLCERHLSQAAGEDRPETKTEHCNDFRQGSIDHEDGWQNAAKMDDTAPDQPTSLSTSHSDAPADAHRQLSLANVESYRPLDSVEAVAGMEMSEQERPAEEHFSNARTLLSDSDSSVFQDEEKCSPSTTMAPAPALAPEDDIVEKDGTPVAPQTSDIDYRFSETATAKPDLGLRPEPGSCGNLTAPTAEGDHASTSLPVSDVSKSAERSHCSIASSVKAVQETGSRGPVETPRRAPHVRMDSLSPFSPILLAGDLKVDMPVTATRDSAIGSRRSTQNPQAGNDTTTARQSVHARIGFLNDTQNQEAIASNHIAPVYLECCVCLEKHGEHNKCEVTECKHRYRELCLKKAIKAGTLRGFQCSSCQAWMKKQRKAVTDSGRL
jgi:hypothetical protein